MPFHWAYQAPYSVTMPQVQAAISVTRGSALSNRRHINGLFTAIISAHDELKFDAPGARRFV